jgi:hypothetical protein
MFHPNAGRVHFSEQQIDAPTVAVAYDDHLPPMFKRVTIECRASNSLSKNTILAYRGPLNPQLITKGDLV